MSVSCGRALPNFHTITVRTMFGPVMLEQQKFEGYNVNLLREQAVDYQIEQAQVHGETVSFQIGMTQEFEAFSVHDNPIESETSGHIGELGE